MPIETLLLLYIPHQIQPQMGFSFPIPVNECLDSLYLPPRSTDCAYNLLELPLYVMSLVMSSLFILADLLSPLCNFLHIGMTTLELERGDPSALLEPSSPVPIG